MKEYIILKSNETHEGVYHPKETHEGVYHPKETHEGVYHSKIKTNGIMPNKSFLKAITSFLTNKRIMSANQIFVFKREQLLINVT